MSKDKDRISKYLIDLNKSILFDELSEDYLNKVGAYDILHGVPVPIAAGMGGDDITNLTIALGMARIVGADGAFKYAENYLEFIKVIFGENAVRVLVSEGAKLAGAGDYEIAAMLFRAALQIDPISQDALFLYGRACKDAYEIETQDEEYVGNYKAESIDSFEALTMLHPNFPMGYYFLGYGYANLGLYCKADLTWQEFMSLTDVDADINQDLRDEIRERLNALVEPVKIEGACNMIMSGDFTQGKEILEQYKGTEYDKWWPLWYHLGIAESSLGNPEAAVEAYKNALQLTPSNTLIMSEIAEVYEALGMWDAASKYHTKIEIVLANQREEKKN